MLDDFDIGEPVTSLFDDDEDFAPAESVFESVETESKPKQVYTGVAATIMYGERPLTEGETLKVNPYYRTKKDIMMSILYGDNVPEELKADTEPVLPDSTNHSSGKEEYQPQINHKLENPSEDKEKGVSTAYSAEDTNVFKRMQAKIVLTPREGELTDTEFAKEFDIKVKQPKPKATKANKRANLIIDAICSMLLTVAFLLICLNEVPIFFGKIVPALIVAIGVTIMFNVAIYICEYKKIKKVSRIISMVLAGIILIAISSLIHRFLVDIPLMVISGGVLVLAVVIIFGIISVTEIKTIK